MLASNSMASSKLSLDSKEINEIVDAIWRIEGGSRTKYPYGIKSVKVDSVEEARQVCRNTVVRNYDRWLAADKPSTYLEFLADRYCPPSVDPKGNRNWKKNIKSIIEEP